MPTRFRAPIASGLAPAATELPGVDAQAGIIRGASAMQAVEALGHDCVADLKTLEAVAQLGNAQAEGVKVRFTHPGLCADGMGTYLGRMKNFRIAGDKVVGDIHLSNAAASSPDGNLRDYVLQLAQEDPGAFGMSVVVEAGRAWVMADGSEIDGEMPKPAECAAALPSLRPSALHAVDVVDEPAANRDGMFGRGAALLALARGTNLDAAEAFAALDRIRDQLGWPADKAQGLLSAYLAARQPKPAPISIARVAALTKERPAHAQRILEAAACEQSEAEIIAAIDAANIAQLASKTEALLAKHAAELKAKDAELKALAAERDAAVAERDQAKALAALARGAATDPGPGAEPFEPRRISRAEYERDPSPHAAQIAAGTLIVTS